MSELLETFEEITPADQKPGKRTRARRSSLKTKDADFRAEIVNRVRQFVSDDETARSRSLESRLQRYAKFRQWTEGKDEPWVGASDVAFPDIMTHSLRVQDTLHNALMSVTPPVSANGNDEVSRGKQDTVDDLLQFQLFVEQTGEELFGQLIDDFVNEGHFVAFIPWIAETREVSQIGRFDPIPENMNPVDYFAGLLETIEGADLEASDDGWDWKGEIDGRRAVVSFYTTKDNVEMVTRKEATVFEGPRIIPKTYEDVLTPPGVENLQIPGPSNPKGSPHVILRDRPTVDEVTRLVKSGYYDLVKDKEDFYGALGAVNRRETEQEEQRKTLQGEDSTPHTKARSQATVTRYMCFDTFDIDGDGLDEDVIWWVIEETQTLVRARIMTEVYPGTPPRRPFAEGQFLPARNSRTGIGLPEMMEGLHDAMKVVLDQLLNAADMGIGPPGFYRPTSNMKNEVIRYAPFELYPLQNPRDDVNIPNIQIPGQALGLNLLTMMNAMEERETGVGDLQLGRVPAGKASALRTVGGMSLVAGQGEARPERILRRFFMGVCQIYEQAHRLNAAFLPDNKLIRIVGHKDESEAIFKPIERRDQVDGRFQFTFGANAFNTGRQQMQTALGQLIPILVSDLAFQMGISDAKTTFNLITDFVKSWGQEPSRYVNKPSPDIMKPRITAEDAITAMLHGQVPDGLPAEGAQAHLQKLLDFSGMSIGPNGPVPNPQDDPHENFGHFREEQMPMWFGYLMEVADRAQQEAARQRLMQAAQQFQQVQGPQQMEPVDQSAAPVNNNELIDETLPTAGGGAGPA